MRIMLRSSLLLSGLGLTLAATLALAADEQPPPAGSTPPAAATDAGAAPTEAAPAKPEMLPAGTVEAFPQALDEAAVVEWLDARTKLNRYKELFAAVEPFVFQEKRPEVQWRLARILVNYYEGYRDAPEKQKLVAYQQAEDLCKKCIATAPNTPGCYLQMGISIGRKATIKGVLRSLRSAGTVEAHWLKGLELSKGKPQYKLDNDLMEAHFYYVLGIFYRIVPDWWIVKVVAGTRGDKQKAIDYGRKSVELRPDPSTWLELGAALMCRGGKEDDKAQYDEGVTWVTKVSQVVPNSEIDKVDKKNARVLLAKPKQACGYSRDKFQDVESEDQVK
jgi:tetratricopeptide (TPR) repeat protein